MLVLVVDDQPDVLTGLRLLFRSEGVEACFANSPAEALARFDERDIDVALLDLNYTRDTTSGGEGLDLVAQLRRIDPELPIVVMTAWSSVQTAVEAMRRGARDYIEKPWDNEQLLATLRRHGEGSAAMRRARADARLASDGIEVPPLVAVSAAMQPVLHLIERVAPSDASVLITGEHGTGKDVVARHLHARSKRRAHAFVPVNVGALASGTFESELFGHVKGAFTGAIADRVGCFELAQGGTLFLDEVGTLALEHQAKLLRVLQNGEVQAVGSPRTRTVDVRTIAATNALLPDEVRAGRFRADVLYRLNTVQIALPPLRERGEDIIPLARSFLERLSARYQLSGLSFSDAALTQLRSYTWPGNVRELAHAVERGVLLARGSSVQASDLGLDQSPSAPLQPAADIEGMTLEQAERYLIERALLRANGNALEAARALGLGRSAFYRRLQIMRGGT